MATQLRQSLKAVLLAGATMTILVPSANAQLSGGDEIIVTATKRAESVQDIPLKIDVVTGETIEDFGIETLTDLSSLVPNFSVGEGITTQAITIRGLGSGQERSFEQAVGLFVDGQYAPRSRQYRAPFFDIERVEVVKGPQAVYFGLNSTAGAVAIQSRKTQPGDAANASVSLEHDVENGGFALEGATGFSDERFGVRLAGRIADKGETFFNTLTDEEENSAEEALLRANLVFQATDNLKLRGKIEYSDFSTEGNIGEIYGLASTAIESAAVLGEDDGILNFRRSSNGENISFPGLLPGGGPGTESESTNIQFGFDYALSNGGVITGLATNSNFDYQLITDLDTTFLSVLDAAIEEDYEQTSLELRYTSPADKPLRYLVGGYYQDYNLTNAQPNIFGTQAGVPGSLLDGGNILFTEGQFELDSELWSAFGIVDYDVSEQLTVSVGARYVDETKDVLRDSRCLAGNTLTGQSGPASLTAILAGAGLCPSLELNGFTNSRSSGNFLPEAKIKYNLNDDVLLFANIGRSAKSGGFASATNASPLTLEFDDESVVGGEIGFKSDLLGGRARLNLTAFRSDFEDLQVNSFVVNSATGATEAAISNAAEATSQGIEIDGSFDVTDWFSIGGSFALLDAEFDNFDTAACNRQLTPDANGACDLSGFALPFAADYSGSVYADFSLPVYDDFSFDGGVLFSFSDNYFTDGTLDTTAVQESWQRLSGHVGISKGDNYKLELIGTNLTNETVLGSTQPFGGSYNIGYLDPPRTVVIKATVGFGN